MLHFMPGGAEYCLQISRSGIVVPPWLAPLVAGEAFLSDLASTFMRSMEL
jgi:hypothetical protein